MKNYPKLIEIERIQKREQQLNELRLFQFLLRNDANLNERFHGKAFEIADGLQPWIDSLELILKE